MPNSISTSSPTTPAFVAEPVIFHRGHGAPPEDSVALCQRELLPAALLRAAPIPLPKPHATSGGENPPYPPSLHGRLCRSQAEEPPRWMPLMLSRRPHCVTWLSPSPAEPTWALSRPWPPPPGSLPTNARPGLPLRGSLKKQGGTAHVGARPAIKASLPP